MSVFQIPPSRKQDRLVNEANLLRLTGHGKDVASVINFAIRHFQETDYPGLSKDWFSEENLTKEVNLSVGLFHGFVIHEPRFEADMRDYPGAIPMETGGRITHLDPKGRAIVVHARPKGSCGDPIGSIDVCSYGDPRTAPVRTTISAPASYLVNQPRNVAGQYIIYLHELCNLNRVGEIDASLLTPGTIWQIEGASKSDLDGWDDTLTYIGLTKQGWQKRFSQHLSKARFGSPLLFHQALRENYVGARIIGHRVLTLCETEKEAMDLEEMFVNGIAREDFSGSPPVEVNFNRHGDDSSWVFGTLYPKGLNMIPGGYAGLKVLHKMGVMKDNQPFNVDQRDNLLIEGLKRGGQANPLLAAHWNDEDYATKVICGPEGRLQPPQIQEARTLGLLGRETSEITDIVGAKNERQIKSLLEGSTYSRIKKLH